MVDRRIYKQVLGLLLVFAFAGGEMLYSSDAEIRLNQKGVPVLHIDDQPVSPLAFFGNTHRGNSFEEGHKIVWEEIRMAAGAGVDIVSYTAPLPWKEGDFDSFDDLVGRILKANADAYLIPRLWLGPPGWWSDKYPEEGTIYADGSKVKWLPSLASEVWREDIEKNLANLIKHVRQSTYADRMIGYHLTYHHTGEWFYWQSTKYCDYSETNRRAFGNWLKKKYTTPKNLRSSWRDQGVTFTEVTIPTKEERTRQKGTIFRNPSEDRRVIDFLEFSSDIMADTILHYNKILKRETNGKALVLSFYGYTMELAHRGSGFVDTGHLSVKKLLRDPNTDMVVAPYSYHERAIGQPSHFHLAADSVMLNNKLYITEDDTYTFLARQPGKGIIAPGYNARTKNIAETIEVLERNYGTILTRHAGLWWMDLLCDGRYSDQRMWDTNKRLKQLYDERLNRLRPYAPEIAVIYDPKSMLYICPNGGGLVRELLHRWRTEFARVGATVGYYVQDDIDKIPDTVKLYVFVNPFYITPTEEETIAKRFKKNGNVIVWTYAPGYVTDKGLSLDRMKKITGIAFGKDDSAHTLLMRTTNSDDPLAKRFQEFKFGYRDQRIAPTFHVNDKEATVLGKYQDTDKPSFAIKDFGNWKSVFCGTPRIPPEIIGEMVVY